PRPRRPPRRRLPRRRRRRPPRSSSDERVNAATLVPGLLLLEDGNLFHGHLRGAVPPTVAEVVFTTNMTGYQEVFTDPSYRGQIVAMTTPLIGNYGVNADD